MFSSTVSTFTTDNRHISKVKEKNKKIIINYNLVLWIIICILIIIIIVLFVKKKIHTEDNNLVNDNSGDENFYNEIYDDPDYLVPTPIIRNIEDTVIINDQVELNYDVINDNINVNYDNIV